MRLKLLSLITLASIGSMFATHAANAAGLPGDRLAKMSYPAPLRVAANNLQVTPAPGKVTSLQSFTVTVEGASEVTRGDVQYSNAPYVIAEGNDTKNFCFNMSFSGNTMTLALSKELTEEGNYTFHVPAGFYNIDGEPATEAKSFDYTVSTDVPVNYNWAVLPEAGNVTSLQSFTVTVDGATEITRGDVQYSNAPYVIAEGSDTKNFCFNMSFSGNTMTLALSKELTEEGNYTFHVPAGFYNIDGEPATEAKSFDYTIVPAIDNDIITEQPAGIRVDCQTEFLSWYQINGMLGGMPLDGKPTHYVLGDDRCLYLYNPIIISPFGPLQTKSYIKGEKNGDEYVFHFPQPIATTMVDGAEQIMYVNYMENVATSTGGTTYQVVGENNFIAFKILENGDCVPVNEVVIGEDDELGSLDIVGYTDAEGNWQAFGNVDMKYLKFTYHPYEIPENSTVQDWIMEYSKGDSPQRLQTPVQIVIRNNEIWVKGFSQTYCPSAWAYGVIDESNNITFEPFLGLAESVGQYAYVYNGLVNSDSSRIYPLVMHYDKGNKVITNSQDLLINPN